MVILHADGELEAIQLEGGFSEVALLAMIRASIGGDLERVPFFDHMPGEPETPCVVFVDEHGKLEGKPPNPLATGLWSMVLEDANLGPFANPIAAGDYLAGDAVLLHGDPEFMAEL